MLLLPVFVMAIGALIVAGVLAGSLGARAKLDRRVKLAGDARRRRGGAAGSPLSPDIVASETAKRESSGPGKRMRGFFAAGLPRTWGMKAGAVKLALVAAVSAAAVLLLSGRALGFSWWLTLPAGALGGYFGPRLLLRQEQESAENQFRDMFPDAVESAVRMLRAGLPMAAAVRAIGAEGIPPVSTVFKMVADQIKIGIPLEEALDTSSRQIGIDDFRFFAVTVLLQQSAGGNITATFETLAGIIRKRRAARLKARSATAEIRLTAYVLGSLPVLTMVALMVLQPGYLMPLFTDRRGHLILAMAAGGLLLAFLVMRQMMRGVTRV